MVPSQGRPTVSAAGGCWLLACWQGVSQRLMLVRAPCRGICPLLRAPLWEQVAWCHFRGKGEALRVPLTPIPLNLIAGAERAPVGAGGVVPLPG